MAVEPVPDTMTTERILRMLPQLQGRDGLEKIQVFNSGRRASLIVRVNERTTADYTLSDSAGALVFDGVVRVHRLIWFTHQKRTHGSITGGAIDAYLDSLSPARTPYQALALALRAAKYIRERYNTAEEHPDGR